MNRAVLLLVMLALPAQAQSQKCFNMQIVYWPPSNGKIQSQAEGSITFNTDGTWSIPSWSLVERMATSENSLGRCVATNLLKARASVVVNNHPDALCPDGWQDGNRNSPIIRPCLPPVACDHGDTCS